MTSLRFLLGLALLGACGGNSAQHSGDDRDGARPDVGAGADAGPGGDGGPGRDGAGGSDGSPGGDGAASRDGAAVDGGATADARRADAGGSGTDAARPDAAAAPDATRPDATGTGGAGDCISGATGTHAVRFRWAGSGSGSTAYVIYDRNELPDASWHVSAANASIGFSPVFVDTFLGEGGLDLGGSTFIDVELSTVGLSTLRGVTIAVRGRSYAVSTSGSFTWQTFDGIGAAPSNSVSNIPPYAWTGVDATTAFSPGDDRVYLRLRAGPSSNNLVVNAVEVCFDAS